MSLVAPAHAAISGVPSTEVPSLMRVARAIPTRLICCRRSPARPRSTAYACRPDQPLAPHKIEAIRLWIAAGARDD